MSPKYSSNMTLSKIGMIKVFRKPEHIFIGGQHKHGIWDNQDIKIDFSSYNINFILMVPLIFFWIAFYFFFIWSWLYNKWLIPIYNERLKKTASEVKMQFRLMSWNICCTEVSTYTQLPYVRTIILC